MARWAWSDLSPSYRARLARNGITPASYAAGVSLSKARGHGQTPERPERAGKHPERYRKYLEENERLSDLVVRRKERLWGRDFKFSVIRSKDNVEVGVVVDTIADYEPHTPSNAILRKALASSDEYWNKKASESAFDAIFGRETPALEWNFLWYH